MLPNPLHLLLHPALRMLLLALSLFTCTAQALPIELAGRSGPPNIVQQPISVQTDTGTLHGTLLLPRAGQPVPVVLIVAGSGPTDRDGNNPEGGRNDSLKRLAVILARNGIASVRYDKRGVAASKEATPNERDLNVEAYVKDVQDWARRLRADRKLGPLFLLGHSEGALVASLAAGQSGAIGLISVAGTGRPVDEVLREQLRKQLPPALLARSLQLLDTLKAGHTDDQVPDELQVVFRPSVQPYLISLLRQDPAAAFAQVRVPALILQGRNDIQVSVEDARKLKQARPEARLVLIDGMNHVLRNVPLDPQQQWLSYRNPTQPLNRQLSAQILRFIKELSARSTVI